MNKCNEEFIKKHNIDLSSIDTRIYTLRDINPIIHKYEVQGRKYNTNISMNDLIGFYEKRNVSLKFPDVMDDFFDELGKKCDLTVLFTDKYRASHDRKLQQYSFKHFNGIFLKGKHFGADRYSFCPEIIDYIKPGIYDRIIICNPSSATGVLAVKHMQLKKIPYWIMGSRAFADMTNLKTVRLGNGSGGSGSLTIAADAFDGSDPVI